MITELESAALNAIAKDCFLDGLEGPDAVGKELWADCGSDNIVSSSVVTRAQVSGIVSSLSKKNLINYFHDGKDSTFSLTEEGAKHIWPAAF